MSHTLLVDSDILFFKFAFRHEKTIDWGDGESSTVKDEEQAIKDFDAFIETLKEATECDEALLCMTHDINFRYSVLPTYKHNRQDKARPDLIKVLKEHCWLTHDCKSVPKLEADDVMGILGSKDPDKYIVTSTDKDMKCVPCTLYNWTHDTEPHRVDEWTADWNFHYQWLIGDSTDGYKGLFRCGPKCAEQLLDFHAYEDWTEAVFEAYLDKGYDREFALQQARVARILRYGEYDFKNKEVILWTP